MDKQINIEELTEEEKWLVETMVFQMDLLVSQMYNYPVYERGYSNIWFNLKEKLGLGDIS